jgi:hypothetical protein
MEVIKPLFSGYIGHLIPNGNQQDEDPSHVFFALALATLLILLLKVVWNVWKSMLLIIELLYFSWILQINVLLHINNIFWLFRPRKFGVDMYVRWNSTYLMLKHTIPYKGIFPVWIKTHHPCKEDGSFY